jgi:alkylated DNA repair dioxygenase AlkB
VSFDGRCHDLRHDPEALMQRSLFVAGPERIDAPDAEIVLHRSVLADPAAEMLFYNLCETTPWRQDKIEIFGTKHDLPRLQQWYGESIYTYSGIQMSPLPWTCDLQDVKREVERLLGLSFNSCLANLYRNGEDTVGWHADDEPELGDAPVIASVSLGVERDFVLRHKRLRDCKRTIALPHGSLLVMSGATQRNWEHSLPRRKGVEQARVNLTFRRLL